MGGNNLSILTSYITSLKNIDAKNINKLLKNAEEDLAKKDLNDQKRFLINQKIDVLKSVTSS